MTMKTWMQGLVLVGLCLLLCTAGSIAQTYELRVLNEMATGGNFDFDLSMLRTGGTPIYLGECDFKLDFNLGNFRSPTAETVSDGLSGWYTISPTISGSMYIVNIQQPPFSTQPQFDQRVTNVSSTGDGSLVGRFRITGISNTSGRVGLTWRHPPAASPTRVTTLAPTTPWNGTNITSSDAGSYIGSDEPLPVWLAAFTVKINPGGPGVRLEWSTMSEVNNYGFYVQRRLPSESQFADLPSSFVAGHGTTLQPQSYSFVDKVLPRPGRYYYRLRQVDLSGKESFSPSVAFSVDLAMTSVVELAPSEFKLHQNYPNPFNPTTELKFSVETLGRAKLHIYSITGQEVAKLFDEVAEPGRYYKVRLDGRKFASGVYFYKLESGSQRDIKKLLLLK